MTHYGMTWRLRGRMAVPVLLVGMFVAGQAAALSSMLDGSDAGLREMISSQGGGDAAVRSVFDVTTPDASPVRVPEPATMLLIGSGLAGIGALRMRRLLPRSGDDGRDEERARG